MARMAAVVSELIWALDQLGFLIRMRLILEQRPLITMEPLSYAAKCDRRRMGASTSPARRHLRDGLKDALRVALALAFGSGNGRDPHPSWRGPVPRSV